MADKQFVSSMWVKPGHEKAPWVKAKLSFKVFEFTQFLEQHAKDDGFVNIDICESKDGQKLYAVLNQWTAEKKVEAAPQTEITGDDIPF